MKFSIGLLQECKTIGNRNKSFGWFAAFWSYVCNVQQCWAKAVALCREAAGAIDLWDFQRFYTVPDLTQSCGLRVCCWAWAQKDVPGAGRVSLERNPVDVCWTCFMMWITIHQVKPNALCPKTTLDLNWNGKGTIEACQCSQTPIALYVWIFQHMRWFKWHLCSEWTLKLPLFIF